MSKNINTTVKKPLNIIFVASEVAPFSKFGGVADVAWALPRTLKNLGHNVKVITPKFAIIEDKKFGIKKYKDNLIVKSKFKDIVCNVKLGIIPDDLEVYFIENMEYYEMRANVYGYKDDIRRFMLLCKASLELIKSEDWPVDIIHSNDWMTGFIPNYLKTEYKNDPKLSKVSSVYTIHNLAYQGLDRRKLTQTQIDQGSSVIPDILDDNISYINGMLRGIIYSDYINTVSEEYSKEILTAQYGEGMEKVLQEMRNKLIGIRNGLDYKVLDPKVDKNVYVNYDVNSVRKKEENKVAFQKEFGLKIDKDIPLVGYVGRFSEQKGLGLLHDTIKPLLDNLNFQFAVVGGDGEYWEKFFAKLIEEYPKRAAGYLMISTTFAHRLYAASDIFIHPSKFEPCGIGHAIAMRFGSVPVVRETGGLVDSVIDYNKDSKRGDGFMFKEFNDMAFLIQLVNAITTFKTNKSEWKKIQNRAMKKDLSWNSSALKYIDLYEKAIDRHIKWQKKEGILMADSPYEVPGFASDDILS